MNKTEILYDTRIGNPNLDSVTYVAIQTDTLPPYVFITYNTHDEGDLLVLPNEFLTIPIETAKRLFDFKEGNLEEMVKRRNKK